jgi:hypothetical protein
MWAFIGVLSHQRESPEQAKKSTGVLGYFVKVGHGAMHFAESVWLGFKLVFGYRRFICTFTFVQPIDNFS